jgi:uncharacterized protein with PIN domain
MNVVVDASALISYLRDEPGAAVVEDHLARNANSTLVDALNLCEVYYDFWRKTDESAAEGAIRDIFLLGIQERNDMGPDFWRAVGKLKALHRRVSLADCCALALANHLGAVLLSADRHELEPLAQMSVCLVEFHPLIAGTRALRGVAEAVDRLLTSQKWPLFWSCGMCRSSLETTAL